jgi:cupin 2 domain-containing protein
MIDTGELYTTLLTTPGVRVERIESRGHVTPDGETYDQTEDEWVFIVEGAARLWLEDRGEISLDAGDHLLIPARCRHRVIWTDPDRLTVWIALFLSH